MEARRKPPNTSRKTVTRRIYVSMPADRWLEPHQNELKWAIVEEIERMGYTPEIFTDPRGRPGLAAGQSWSAVEAHKVARRCVGAVIIGMPRWTFPTPEGDRKLPTEYCHYEGAVAYTLGLPMLVVVQQDVQRRVVFDSTFRGHVGEFPPTAGKSWLLKKDFEVPFYYWNQELAKRSDVFLGYCSTSAETAKKVKHFLHAGLGLKVLDWQTDFIPGRSILQQIEEAAARCSAGIFLFTKDDKLPNQEAPRDNVVFEAGYFINAKGKDHVLIIREDGAKMLADLGGDIYALLKNKSKIEPIKEVLRRFVSSW